MKINKMKKSVLILLSFLIFGCAGSKKAVYSPVGAWEYTVIGTPNGDTSGTFILTQTEEGMKGVFKSYEYGESDLESLTYGESQDMKCTLYLSGMDLSMTGVFEGDTFSGTIDAGQNGSFPITATRNTSN